MKGKRMDCVIVANAPEFDARPFAARIRTAELVIAADGGARALLQIGYTPQRVVGDLDSLEDAEIDELARQGAQIERHGREKDETDLELALLLAAAYGATQIDILGALGGRWDHSLANVALLALPELRGRRVRLLDRQQETYLVQSQAQIEGQRGDTVSLLPVGGAATGVSTRGLYYRLQDSTLAFERARGISNILIDPPGEVSVRAGLLLIVHHFDGGAYQWQNYGQPS